MKMNAYRVAAIILGVLYLTGCDASVSSAYSTRVDAEADRLFERGWLPDFIPRSSRSITMTNNLDLNISSGEFRFDASEYDEFVAHLNREPAMDKNGSSSYSFDNWLFWLGPDRNSCIFRLDCKRKDGSEQRRPLQ